MRQWLVLPVSIAVSVPVNPLVNIPVDAFRVGFKDLVARIACIRMGFKGYHLKTHANSSIMISNAHKTRVNSIRL